MPSAEEPTYLKVIPEPPQDFLTHDVDLLVSQIKENLRLSSLKAKSSVSQRCRVAPYLAPSRVKMRRFEAGYRLQKSKDKAEDDPYEKLRELLEQGRLISEAVKKLQKTNIEALDDSEGEEDHLQGIHRVYRRKDYYYDSEDEPLPEVYDPELV
ncbi:uncharacterized protein LOC107048078 [Diachasma alloeum]|uniref:uncharacterized protein LOC107048078 n=1 Tax=Diachasma alloeum TaxID=454923 RepID=UPI0007383483|nr:uncharacterized protein LOC107048078 [Diachasma alloeum]